MSIFVNMNNNKKIKEIVDFYYSLKKDDNDYLLYLDNEVEINTFDSKTNSISKNKTNVVSTNFDLLNKNNKLVSDLEVEKLSQDLIDNKFFWKYIVEKFPFFSISQYPKCKSDEDVNKANLNASMWLGFYQKIYNFLKNNNTAKILEIGPGYGSLFYPINNNFDTCDYWAIDINPLFYFEGLVESNGSEIPVNVGGNFDFIFSFNVFNHLSKKQRSSYYKSVYNSLKKKGRFLFTNFLIVDLSNEIDYWNYKDENNNIYTSFFSQLTKVDEYNNLADELNDIGFSVNIKMNQNTAIIDCQKI